MAQTPREENGISLPHCCSATQAWSRLSPAATGALAASGIEYASTYTTLVLRFTKTLTNEIDGFVRQARAANRSDTQWYREDLQRGMADKDAISCQGFGETQY
jgi:hypothetical protein